MSALSIRIRDKALSSTAVERIALISPQKIEPSGKTGFT